MTNATVTAQSATQDKRRRLALKRARQPLRDRCRALGITHDDIAAEARCHRTYVVQYFSGRRSPRAVELAAEKLIAERQAKAS